MVGISDIRPDLPKADCFGGQVGRDASDTTLGIARSGLPPRQLRRARCYAPAVLIVFALLACSPDYLAQYDCEYVDATSGPFSAAEAEIAFLGTWLGIVEWACDTVNCDDVPEGDEITLTIEGTGAAETDWKVASGDPECQSSVSLAWAAQVADTEGLFTGDGAVPVRVYGAEDPRNAEGAIVVVPDVNWPASLPVEIELLIWLFLDSETEVALVESGSNGAFLGSASVARAD